MPICKTPETRTRRRSDRFGRRSSRCAAATTRRTVVATAYRRHANQIGETAETPTLITGQLIAQTRTSSAKSGPALTSATSRINKPGDVFRNETANRFAGIDRRDDAATWIKDETRGLEILGILVDVCARDGRDAVNVRAVANGEADAILVDER